VFSCFANCLLFNYEIFSCSLLKLHSLQNYQNYGQKVCVNVLFTFQSVDLFPGFDDAFKAIERLSMYAFNLPVNVAVKQFQDMNEAF
jgi:hypothetical protein